VPLDGSQLAQEALPVALSLAEKFRSQLHLVRAIPIPAGENVTGMLEMMEREATSYLAETARNLDVPSGVRTEVALGPAAAKLIDYADAHGVDLVVVTSHGRGGFSRTALGSVTDRLLGGPCPVLIVRAENTNDTYLARSLERGRL
jgi:nucleotide-binding universal stress UspA family protein